MERIRGTSWVKLEAGEYLIGLSEEIVRGPKLISEESVFDNEGRSYIVILPIFGDQKITVEGKSLEEAVKRGHLP